MRLTEKYTKTNLFIIDENLWKWAKYRAEVLGFDSVAEYIFELIRLDKDKNILKK
jgi:dolichyl-phosphate-mannose--protein O-mannosyl transferase